MCTVSVSYSSLWDASREAKDVAKKLDKYADQLNSKVIKKLDKYNGDWSSNLSVAKSKTNQKITELRNEQAKYENFSRELSELRQECKDVDNKVRTKVSSLTAQFKDSHGIKNNVVVNYISYILTSRTNSTAGGRWVNNRRDEVCKEVDYVKDAIKEWYSYEGGKEFIKGALVAILEIVIAVCVLLNPASSIFALIGAAIALAGGIINMANELYGLLLSEEDPATGRRRGRIDTLTEWIRKDFDSKFMHGAATVLDVVNLVAAICNIGTECWKITKNAINWFKTGGVPKLFSSGSKTWNDIMAAFRNNTGWAKVKEFSVDAMRDFMRNFVDDFFIGEVQPLDGIKNVASLSKDLITGDTLASLAGLLLPGFGGDWSDVGDLVFDEFFSDKLWDSPLFDKSGMDGKVLEKLADISDIDISVPDIPVPEIPRLTMPDLEHLKLRTA